MTKSGKFFSVGLAALLIFIVLGGLKFVLIKSEEVEFVSGDLVLKGKISTHRFKSGSSPGIVIVHGSGVTTRKDVQGYVHRLVPMGFGVLTYDKRSTGESAGNRSEIFGVVDSLFVKRLASDASAAFDELITHPKIDKHQSGLLGGSQAGWIMPMASVLNSKISFLVSISGPACTFGEENFWSNLNNGNDVIDPKMSVDSLKEEMKKFVGPHGYDPKPVLETLRIPSLWILGEKDGSVPTHLTIKNLNAIDGGIDLRIYPYGEHSLKNWNTGKRINYWKDIEDWFKEKGILIN